MEKEIDFTTLSDELLYTYIKDYPSNVINEIKRRENEKLLKLTKINRKLNEKVSNLEEKVRKIEGKDIHTEQKQHTSYNKEYRGYKNIEKDVYYTGNYTNLQ